MPPPKPLSPADEPLPIFLWLQATYLFANLDADAVAHLAGQIDIVETAQGPPVAREADAANALHVADMVAATQRRCPKPAASTLAKTPEPAASRR